MPQGYRNAAAAIEAAADETQREFAFSDEDFRSLVRVAHEQAGIALADNKRNLVYSRLSRRLRALNLRSFKNYRDYLTANADELESFINAISTNLTKFFRESHHFDHLRSHVAAPFSQSARSGARRLRIWSAGCSTGEEPYTIAMMLDHEIRDIDRYDIRILATDIDTDVIGKGVAGRYPAGAIDDVPHAYRDYFRAEPGSRAEISVAPELRTLIAFRRLNLMHQWPFKGPFDAIFCRNVMIYFDGDTKASLIERFTAMLKPGGWLYIGHSESLVGGHPGLKLVGRTVYRRDA